MSHQTKISLSVCTHNGASRIEDTLWSLILQSAAADLYEIVVVDNASEDEASLRAIVERFSGGAHDVVLEKEPLLGLSHARNKAIEVSQGEYVCFVDDDAVANPRLVERYLEAIAEYAPDVLGSDIVGLFESMPPDEVDYRYWPEWSLKLFGGKGRWLNDGEYFLGANLVVARRILEERPFDPKLGRRGGKLIGGEEKYLGGSEFSRRYVAGAYVFHKVGRERMTLEYLAARMSSGRGYHPKSAIRRSILPFRLSKALHVAGSELSLAVRRLLFAFQLGRERRRI